MQKFGGTSVSTEERRKHLAAKVKNIIDSGICSVCNSDLIHSFRAEKEGYGLETALIELTD